METFEDLKEKLGNNVRYFRNKEKLSQEQLANKSGINGKQYISLIELGRADVQLSSIYKLSQALNVSLKELLISDFGKSNSDVEAQKSPIQSE